VRPSERRAACKHLEQDGARREQIASRVEGLARCLFGRHVARRADRDSTARQHRGRAKRSLLIEPCQAEVEQLHAVRGEEHVGRLEVAGHETAGV
jgi:hypothetical protein